MHRPPEALDAPVLLRVADAGLPGGPLLRRIASAATAAGLAAAIVLSLVFTGM